MTFSATLSSQESEVARSLFCRRSYLRTSLKPRIDCRVCGKKQKELELIKKRASENYVLKSDAYEEWYFSLRENIKQMVDEEIKRMPEQSRKEFFISFNEVCDQQAGNFFDRVKSGFSAIFKNKEFLVRYTLYFMSKLNFIGASYLLEMQFSPKIQNLTENVMKKSVAGVYFAAKINKLDLLPEMESIVFRLYMYLKLFLEPQKECEKRYPGIFVKLRRLLECSPIPFFQNLLMWGIYETQYLSIASLILVTCSHCRLVQLYGNTILYVTFDVFPDLERIQDKGYKEYVQQIRSSLNISLQITCDYLDQKTKSTLAQSIVYFPGYSFYAIIVGCREKVSAKSLQEVLSVINYYGSSAAQFYSTVHFFDSNFRFCQQSKDAPEIDFSPENFNTRNELVQFTNFVIDSMLTTKYVVRHSEFVVPAHFNFEEMFGFPQIFLVLNNNPLLCTAFMTVRILAIVLRCEKQMWSFEYKIIYDQYKLTQAYCYTWLVDLFYNLGSISLLLSQYSFRFQGTLTAGNALNLKTLLTCVDSELQQLRTKGTEQYITHFQKFFLNEIYADAFPMILQSQHQLLEIAEFARQWLIEFRNAQNKFVGEWHQAQKAGDWRTIDMESLTSSAFRLREVWYSQPTGLPFFNEMINGVSQALVLSEGSKESSQYLATGNKPWLLYELASFLLRIKMVIQRQSLVDLQDDEFCIMMLDFVVANYLRSNYLWNALQERLPKLEKSNPFTKLLMFHLPQILLRQGRKQEYLAVLRTQNWEQDLNYLNIFTESLILQFWSSDMLEQSCQLNLLRPCYNDNERYNVCQACIWLIKYLQFKQWENLLVSAIRSILQPVDLKTSELILLYVPDGILYERVVNQLSEEQLKHMLTQMRLALIEVVYRFATQVELTEDVCVRLTVEQMQLMVVWLPGAEFVGSICLWMVLLAVRQTVFDFQSDLQFVDLAVLKDDGWLFQGDLMERGKRLDLIDIEFVKELIQKVQDSQQNDSNKVAVLHEVVKWMQRLNCFTQEMNDFVVSHVTESNYNEKDTLKIMLLLEVDGQATEGLLVDYIESALSSGSIPSDLSAQVTKIFEKQYQVRVLTAIFDFEDQKAFTKEEKLLFATQFKESVPSACVSCNKLTRFISQNQLSIDWFELYGTVDEINTVISSAHFVIKFQTHLALYLLQTNSLHIQALQTLLQNEAIEREVAENLLNYAQSQEMNLDIECFVNTLQKFDIMQVDSFLQFGVEFTNKFIKAAQIQQKPQLVIDIIAHMKSSDDLDAVGLDGFILASKQLGFGIDAMWAIVSERQPFLSQVSYIQQITVQGIGTIFDLILEYQPISFLQYVETVLSAHPCSKQVLQFLLTRASCILQEQFFVDNVISQQQVQIVNEIIDLSLEVGISIRNIQQAFILVLEKHPSWQFSQGTFFDLLYQMVEQNMFDQANDVLVLYEHPIFYCSQEQRTLEQFFVTLIQKIQQVNEVSVTLQLLLNQVLQQEFGDKGRIVLQIAKCVFEHTGSSYFGTVLLQDHFVDDIKNADCIIQLLNVMHEYTPECKLPESITKSIEKRLAIILPQLSPQVMEMYAKFACGVADGATLQCYSNIHSKYKQNVTSELWKCALISADKVQNYEEGYKILNHVAQEKRESNTEWKLDSEELRLSEINIVINASDDMALVQEMIDRFCCDYDVLPQTQINDLCRQVVESANPRLCSNAVELVVDILKRKRALHTTLRLDTLMATIHVAVMSDGSVNKQNIAAFLLLICLQNDLYRQNLDLVNKFLGQCLLCGSELLPALVAIAMSTGEIGNELLEQLESDQSAQKWLGQTFNCGNFLYFVYEAEDGDVLKNMCAQKQYTERIGAYLEKFCVESAQVIETVQEQDSEALEEQFQSLSRVQWLELLSQDSQWKQWPLDKLQSCGFKLIGNKLKKYKQRKDIIWVLEKEVYQELNLL